MFHLRLSTPADVAALRGLIDLSVRGLSDGYYTPAQVESALRYVLGPDTQLIADRTYYVVATPAGELVAAGGWGKRRTLHGGDQAKGSDDPLLDPATDAARIRAFFVHPAWGRRGRRRVPCPRVDGDPAGRATLFGTGVYSVGAVGGGAARRPDAAGRANGPRHARGGRVTRGERPMDDQPLRVQYVGGVAVVGLGDHAPGEPLPDGGLLALLDQTGGRAVIDLTGCTSLSTAPLGKMIVASRRALALGGALRLCCAPWSVRELLEVTKLDSVILPFPTLADALQGF